MSRREHAWTVVLLPSLDLNNLVTTPYASVIHQNMWLLALSLTGMYSVEVVSPNMVRQEADFSVYCNIMYLYCKSSLGGSCEGTSNVNFRSFAQNDDQFCAKL